MLTGFEIPIIAALTGKVVATFKFSRTSVLLDDTRNILNDERLTKLLTLLYELDPKLAFENNEFREEVEAMFNDLSLMKGGKYILIRHISARKAKSLAKEYKHMITKNTNDARIKQAQEKARMREQLVSEDILSLSRRPSFTLNKGIAQTTIVDRGSRPHSRYTNRAAVANNHQTFQYIDQNPDIAVFAYPRGTPENPTVSCPVGSKPILPDGFKFGTLAYYYQPSHVAMISSDESSSATQTEEDDLVPVIEIRDMPKSSRSGVAQASSPSHRRQSINREELVEDIIREELQDIAGTAHFIGTLRAANGSDGDVASIATTYLSFDDMNTESESNFDSDVDTDGL